MNETEPRPRLDSGSTLTKQAVINQYLIDRLESGDWAPGDRLPTERELATQVEVARSTVTKALTELERKGLIRRIQGRGTFVHEKAIERLRSTSGVFAIIVPASRIGFYQTILSAFEDAARDGNHQIVFVSSNDDPLRQGDALLQLVDRGISGVAVVPATKSEAQGYQFGVLRRAGIPVVLCNRRVDGVEDVPVLQIDPEALASRAADVLVRHGHRTIALHQSHRYHFYERLEEAFRKGLRDRLGNDFNLIVRYGDPDREHDERGLEIRASWIRELRSMATPPTAIFSSFDAVSESLYYVMTRQQIRIPEDMALLSIGGKDRGAGLSAYISAVTIDASRIGRRAFELLQRIAEGDTSFAGFTETIPIDYSEGCTLT